jgi:hypothetical protein
MTDAAHDTSKPKPSLEDQIKALDRELRLLKRTSERQKSSPFMPGFGMQPPFNMPPPPPMPQPGMMAATGPMMMAWLMSWLYSSGAANPAMLDQMTRFAANREDFWHQSLEALASMANQPSNGQDHTAVSAEDKKKIKAALEEKDIDPDVIDAVFHAMNMLDVFQQYRGAASHGRR